MRLTQEEYKALEEIVGPEYITQDPVIMESYCQVWGNKVQFGDKRHRPAAAVLLPGSTEEIQAIVRFCNKAGILFKPSARAFEYVATYLSHERGILLELKRLNRILEIDPKNMHAVVEPFVTVYELIDAASKQGFYVGKPGVGYSAAVISLACCHQEMTISQLFTSGYGRNVLGARVGPPHRGRLEPGYGQSRRGLVLRGRAGLQPEGHPARSRRSQRRPRSHHQVLGEALSLERPCAHRVRPASGSPAKPSPPPRSRRCPTPTVCTCSPSPIPRG